MQNRCFLGKTEKTAILLPLQLHSCVARASRSDASMQKCSCNASLRDARKKAHLALFICFTADKASLRDARERSKL